MIRFLVAVAQAIAQMISECFKLATTFVGMIEEMMTKLFGGGHVAPAAPVDNIDQALPDLDRLDRAEELAEGEVKAVDNLMTRSPAQQAQIFASMPVEDRILADLSLLRQDQVDWLNGLQEGQLRIVAEATERRVSEALSGKPQSLMAILSVGQAAPNDETTFAHRLVAKRASQLSPTHPPAYGLQ